jgi:hypothetical protein
MTMIEKGLNPSNFDSKANSTSHTLKFGLLCVGIALGIMIANVLYKNDILERVPAYFSMTFLFGGLSLILNFIIERKLRR